MWTSRISNLQKTYDESYLICSTAVYYESQGNEKEAIRYWRSALDQLSHNLPPKSGSHLKSETERALVDSLRELELQCKERIDLLEALRVSREEGTALCTNTSPVTPGNAGMDSADGPSTGEREKGWIGNGTIPAITYPELSRPTLPPNPVLPPRPSLGHVPKATPERTATDRTASYGNFVSAGPAITPSSTYIPRVPPLPSHAPPALPMTPRDERPLSPDKRTMRTTLRSGKSEKASKTSKTTKRLAKNIEEPGAGRAATAAWSSIISRSKPDNLPLGSPAFSSVESSAPGICPSPARRVTPGEGCRWDRHSRRLVTSNTDDGVQEHSKPDSPLARRSTDNLFSTASPLAMGAASSALNAVAFRDRQKSDSGTNLQGRAMRSDGLTVVQDALASGNEMSTSGRSSVELPVSGNPISRNPIRSNAIKTRPPPEPNSTKKRMARPSGSTYTPESESAAEANEKTRSRVKGKVKESPVVADLTVQSSAESVEDEDKKVQSAWEKKKRGVLKSLPPGVDSAAAKAIFNEIVVQGDEVHWSDVAGLGIAKTALREAVVYPFLRPDLFMGLREPARGMLLFGPPGTGKTMLARAVATESRSTFFSISASSLTSKYLGESEKLVRALFAVAKAMAPSIIFVDEIDSLLSRRSGSGGHEATERIKTEFLIQWSDLQRAAAGRESAAGEKDARGDANRVLVLAATNLPWAIDEAARRRFVRRQYIPLPEAETRETQLKTLLGQQKHSLTASDIAELVTLTDGFSGSDITALAKDAAMGPLRSLGEALLHMTMDQIRPIELVDFKTSLTMIRPSVGKESLKEYEDWARQYGERGG